MTRFIMTLSEAVALVMEVVDMAKGGEVFVNKMPVCRIEDLAITMVEEMAPLYGYDPRDVPIRIVGPIPGEKFHEELMNEEEIRRTIELKRHFVIVPAFRSNSRRVDYSYPHMLDHHPEQPYNSSTAAPMSRDELRHYLRDNKFLDV